MEHISQSLANFPSNIPNQTNYATEEPEVDKTVEKLRSFNVSSFEHTFEKFNKVQGTEEAYILMNKLANGGTDRKFVLLYGQTGCGKTHLIEATVIAWAKKGIRSRYSTMSQLMRRLKIRMREKGIPTYDEVFEAICDTPRLIIDDVGMGTIESKWEVAELEDIINERYHRRYYQDGKVTIMATNKDITDLPDRIVSRFYDPEFGVVVYMDAKDYRRRK